MLKVRRARVVAVSVISSRSGCRQNRVSSHRLQICHLKIATNSMYPRSRRRYNVMLVQLETDFSVEA